jgi:hypothetical protein
MGIRKHKSNKNFNNFGLYLRKTGIESAYCHVKLFIEKFSKSRNINQFQKITDNCLRKRNILPSNFYKDFAGWRLIMLKNNLLTCKASREELLSNSYLESGYIFKIGDRIQPYIEIGQQDMLLDVVYDYKETLDKLIKEVENTNKALENTNKALDTKLEIEKMVDLEKKLNISDDKMNKVYHIFLNKIV